MQNQKTIYFNFKKNQSNEKVDRAMNYCRLKNFLAPTFCTEIDFNPHKGDIGNLHRYMVDQIDLLLDNQFVLAENFKQFKLILRQASENKVNIHILDQEIFISWNEGIRDQDVYAVMKWYVLGKVKFTLMINALKNMNLTKKNMDEFSPDSNNRILIDIFDAEIDHIHGDDNQQIKIGAGSWFPSDIWKQMDETGYNIAKKNFCDELTDDQKEKFAFYRCLKDEYEKQKKICYEIGKDFNDAEI